MLILLSSHLAVFQTPEALPEQVTQMLGILLGFQLKMEVAECLSSPLLFQLIFHAQEETERLLFMILIKKFLYFQQLMSTLIYIPVAAAEEVLAEAEAAVYIIPAMIGFTAQDVMQVAVEAAVTTLCLDINSLQKMEHKLELLQQELLDLNNQVLLKSQFTDISIQLLQSLLRVL